MIMRAAGLAASAAVAAAALGAHAVDVSEEGFMFSGYGCDRSCDQGDVNYEIEYVGGAWRRASKPRVCHVSAPLSRSCCPSLALSRSLGYGTGSGSCSRTVTRAPYSLRACRAIGTCQCGAAFD